MASSVQNNRDLWVGLVLGSVATIAATWLVNNNRRRSSTSSTRDQGGTSNNNHRNNNVDFLPDDIRAEQISRHTLYFGTTGMQNLKDSKILVVGLGGVGSHTAHMLARSGVGHLKLVDFDQVSISSLNRHACAVLDDVGTPKTTCLLQFCRNICPDKRHLKLEGHTGMFQAETADEIFAIHNDNNNDDDDNDSSSTSHQKWDLVIDCIDDVPTKALLLYECLQRQIPCMSSMGAGGKADVTRLHISDLRTASKDPLSTKLRWHLKKLMKEDNNSNSNNSTTTTTTTDDNDDYTDNMDKISIIYSSEKTVVKLADFTPEQKIQGVHNFGAVDQMRIRIIPVLGTMPAVMGQSLAAMALTKLGSTINTPTTMQPITGERIGRTVRHKLFQSLTNRETKFIKQVLLDNNMDPTTITRTNGPEEGIVVPDGRWVGRLQVDETDMEYLYAVWRNRCAITQARTSASLRLTRWDVSKPSTCDNLVLLSGTALEKFDRTGGKDGVAPKFARIIEERLATCQFTCSSY